MSSTPSKYDPRPPLGAAASSPTVAADGGGGGTTWNGGIAGGSGSPRDNRGGAVVRHFRGDSDMSALSATQAPASTTCASPGPATFGDDGLRYPRPRVRDWAAKLHPATVDLILAVDAEDPDAVGRAVSAGADVDVRRPDRANATPLQLAASHREPDCMNVLLSSLTKPRLLPDDHGVTALHACAEFTTGNLAFPLLVLAYGLTGHGHHPANAASGAERNASPLEGVPAEFRFDDAAGAASSHLTHESDSGTVSAIATPRQEPFMSEPTTAVASPKSAAVPHIFGADKRGRTTLHALMQNAVAPARVINNLFEWVLRTHPTPLIVQIINARTAAGFTVLDLAILRDPQRFDPGPLSDLHTTLLTLGGRAGPELDRSRRERLVQEERAGRQGLEDDEAYRRRRLRKYRDQQRLTVQRRVALLQRVRRLEEKQTLQRQTIELNQRDDRTAIAYIKLRDHKAMTALAEQKREEYGATTLQAHWRGRKARGHVKLERKKSEQRLSAAKNIQRVYRGHRDRNYVKELRSQIFAVVILQRLWRRAMAVRRRQQLEAERQRTRRAAALAILCVFRRRWVEARVVKRYEAMMAPLRDWIDACRVAFRRNVVRIQTWWRMLRVKGDFKGKKAAALCLQSHFRDRQDCRKKRHTATKEAAAEILRRHIRREMRLNRIREYVRRVHRKKLRLRIETSTRATTKVLFREAFLSYFYRNRSNFESIFYKHHRPTSHEAVWQENFLAAVAIIVLLLEIVSFFLYPRNATSLIAPQFDRLALGFLWFRVALSEKCFALLFDCGCLCVSTAATIASTDASFAYVPAMCGILMRAPVQVLRRWHEETKSVASIVQLAVSLIGYWLVIVAALVFGSVQIIATPGDLLTESANAGVLALRLIRGDAAHELLQDNALLPLDAIAAPITTMSARTFLAQQESDNVTTYIDAYTTPEDFIAPLSVTLLVTVALRVAIAASVCAAVHYVLKTYHRQRIPQLLSRWIPDHERAARMAKVSANAIAGASARNSGLQARWLQERATKPVDHHRGGGGDIDADLYDCTVEAPMQQYIVDADNAVTSVKMKDPITESSFLTSLFKHEWTAGCFERIANVVIVSNLIMTLTDPYNPYIEYAFSALYTVEVIMSLVFCPGVVWSRKAELLVRLFNATIGFISPWWFLCPARSVRLICGLRSYWYPMYVHFVCFAYCVYFALVCFFVGAAAAYQGREHSDLHGTNVGKSLHESAISMVSPEHDHYGPPLFEAAAELFRRFVVPLALMIVAQPILGLGDYALCLTREAIDLLRHRLQVRALAITESEAWYLGRRLPRNIKASFIVRLKLLAASARRRVRLKTHAEAKLAAAEKAKNAPLEASASVFTASAMDPFDTTRALTSHDSRLGPIFDAHRKRSERRMSLSGLHQPPRKLSADVDVRSATSNDESTESVEPRSDESPTHELHSGGGFSPRSQDETAQPVSPEEGGGTVPGVSPADEATGMYLSTQKAAATPPAGSNKTELLPPSALRRKSADGNTAVGPGKRHGKAARADASKAATYDNFKLVTPCANLVPALLDAPGLRGPIEVTEQRLEAENDCIPTVCVSSAVTRSAALHYSHVLISLASVVLLFFPYMVSGSDIDPQHIGVHIIHWASLALSLVLIPRDVTCVLVFVYVPLLLVATFAPSVFFLRLPSILRVFTWQIAPLRPMVRAVRRAMVLGARMMPVALIVVAFVVCATAMSVGPERALTGERRRDAMVATFVAHVEWYWSSAAWYIEPMMIALCCFLGLDATTEKFSSTSAVVISRIPQLLRPSESSPATIAARRFSEANAFYFACYMVLVMNLATVCVVDTTYWGPFRWIDLSCALVFFMHSTVAATQQWGLPQTEPEPPRGASAKQVAKHHVPPSCRPDPTAIELRRAFDILLAFDVVVCSYVVVSVLLVPFLDAVPRAVYTAGLALRFLRIIHFVSRDVAVGILYNMPLILGSITLVAGFLSVMAIMAAEASALGDEAVLSSGLILAVAAVARFPRRSVDLFGAEPAVIIVGIAIRLMLIAMIALVVVKTVPFWAIHMEGLSARANALYRFLIHGEEPPVLEPTEEEEEDDEDIGAASAEADDADAELTATPSRPTKPPLKHKPRRKPQQTLGDDIRVAHQQNTGNPAASPMKVVPVRVEEAPPSIIGRGLNLRTGCSWRRLAGQDYWPRWQVPFVLEGLKLVHVAHQRHLFRLVLHLVDFLAVADERANIVSSVSRAVDVMSAGGPADYSAPDALPRFPDSYATGTAGVASDSGSDEDEAARRTTGNRGGRGGGSWSGRRLKTTARGQRRLTAQEHADRSVERGVSTMRLVQALHVVDTRFPASSSHEVRMWTAFLTAQRKLVAATLMQAAWRMFVCIQRIERQRSRQDVGTFAFLRSRFRVVRMRMRATLFRKSSLAEALNTAPLVYNTSGLHLDFCLRLNQRWEELNAVKPVPLTPLDEAEPPVWLHANLVMPAEGAPSPSFTRYQAVSDPNVIENSVDRSGGGGGGHDLQPRHLSSDSDNDADGAAAADGVNPLGPPLFVSTGNKNADDTTSGSGSEPLVENESLLMPQNLPVPGVPLGGGNSAGTTLSQRRGFRGLELTPVTPGAAAAQGTPHVRASKSLAEIARGAPHSPMPTSRTGGAASPLPEDGDGSRGESAETPSRRNAGGGNSSGRGMRLQDQLSSSGSDSSEEPAKLAPLPRSREGSAGRVTPVASGTVPGSRHASPAVRQAVKEASASSSSSASSTEGDDDDDDEEEESSATSSDRGSSLNASSDSARLGSGRTVPADQASMPQPGPALETDTADAQAPPSTYGAPPTR